MTADQPESFTPFGHAWQIPDVMALAAQANADAGIPDPAPHACTRCSATSQRGCEDWDCHLGWTPAEKTTAPRDGAPALTPPALLLDQIDADAQIHPEVAAAWNPRLTAALRAVLNLHHADDDVECAGCRAECLYCEADHPWPCPTVEAITDVLNDTHPMRPNAPMGGEQP